MALRQHSPLRVSHDTSVIYEAKRNQNMTLKKVIKREVARYGTWTHDPQIKSLMLYRLS